MVQDFAKKKPAADRQSAPPGAPPPWGMLLAGTLTGLLAGFFISFLAYISGVLPDRPRSAASEPAIQDTAVDEAAQNRLTADLERAAQRLQLEFYQELPNYEVVVDATPLDQPGAPEQQTADSTVLTTPERSPSGPGYMVQAGAFQQQSSAVARRDQLAELGLDARVKQEALLGRTLYLVQAGPYPDRESLGRAERILRNNNIESMRISPGSR